MLFSEYYSMWIDLYKRGAVRDVTLKKYTSTLSHIKELAGELQLEDVNRASYQNLLNKFAETHEKQTVTDFHHMIRPCLLDALDEGIIKKDPTRRITIKGKPPAEKKTKYVNYSAIE